MSVAASGVPGVSFLRVAANAVIVRGGRALLVEFSGGSEARHFNFPGGGVELGETLEEAVRREVREETCLEVRVERLLLIVEAVGSRNTNVIGGQRVPWNEVRFFFLCTPTDPDAIPCLPDVPDGTQTGVVWVALDSLEREPLLPPIAQDLLAALAHPAAGPGIIPCPHDGEAADRFGGIVALKPVPSA